MCVCVCLRITGGVPSATSSTLPSPETASAAGRCDWIGCRRSSKSRPLPAPSPSPRSPATNQHPWVGLPALSPPPLCASFDSFLSSSSSCSFSFFPATSSPCTSLPPFLLFLLPLELHLLCPLLFFSPCSLPRLVPYLLYFHCLLLFLLSNILISLLFFFYCPSFSLFVSPPGCSACSSSSNSPSRCSSRCRFRWRGARRRRRARRQATSDSAPVSVPFRLDPPVRR